MEIINKEQLAKLRFPNENHNNIQLTKDIELRQKVYVIGFNEAESIYIKQIEEKDETIEIQTYIWEKDQRLIDNLIKELKEAKELLQECDDSCLNNDILSKKEIKLANKIQEFLNKNT